MDRFKAQTIVMCFIASFLGVLIGKFAYILGLAVGILLAILIEDKFDFFGSKDADDETD